MAKHRTRVVIATAGGTMLTLAVASIGLRLSTWANDHHSTLTGFTIACSLGAVVAAFAWLMTKDDSEKLHQQGIIPANAPVSSPGNSAGRDNNGKQIFAEHYHEAPALQKQADRPLPDARLIKVTGPALTALLFEFKENRDVRLPGVSESSQICLLPIKNPIGGGKADSVCASLEFYWNGLRQGSVERAHWLKQEGHEITIETQTTAKILVGCYENGTWFYWHNPQQFTRSFYDHWNEMETEGYEFGRIPLSVGGLVMEVIVFNRHRATGYLRKRYTITPVDDGKAVTIVGI